MWHFSDIPGRANDVRNLRQGRHGRCAHRRPKKLWNGHGPRLENPETGAYPGCSAPSCKSLQPQISRKSAEFPRHFKGHFSIGNVQVRILRGQPGIPAFRQAPQERREWAGNAGFRAFGFVSRLPNRQSQDANRRKSPATPATIPVLQRLPAETGFDHDSRPLVAVKFAVGSSPGRAVSGTCTVARGRQSISHCRTPPSTMVFPNV
jgi:hypothetical protein